MSKQENGNVVQGPWPKTKRKVKLPDETAIELQERLGFAEELTQTVIVQMMHTLGQNGIDISDNAFVRDMALVIEMTKGSIYRSLDLNHITHGLFEALVELQVDPDNSVATEVNQDLLEEYIKLFGDDDDPEIP
ncbi:uncharacterized protein METZ01_LOCUS288727 [marine metagenome]|uniref:Uncharacterized protein n=1 Tax=marine metagenome TaxID=408172 RepID=A0A382LI13_9ZZZZ|tara:strand:+ start:31 stop:432 length:402 start_codon:yes stop_codon:yes gene_type:complete